MSAVSKAKLDDSREQQQVKILKFEHTAERKFQKLTLINFTFAILSAFRARVKKRLKKNRREVNITFKDRYNTHVLVRAWM